MSDIMRKCAYLSLAALPLLSCGERLAWHRDGATPEESSRDRAECTAEARAYAFMDGGGVSERIETPDGEHILEIDPYAEHREAELFESCMRARGYVRTEVEAP